MGWGVDLWKSGIVKTMCSLYVFPIIKCDDRPRPRTDHCLEEKTNYPKTSRFTTHMFQSLLFRFAPRLQPVFFAEEELEDKKKPLL